MKKVFILLSLFSLLYPNLINGKNKMVTLAFLASSIDGTNDNSFEKSLISNANLEPEHSDFSNLKAVVEDAIIWIAQNGENSNFSNLFLEELSSSDLPEAIDALPLSFENDQGGEYFNFITVDLQRPIHQDFELSIPPNPFEDFAVMQFGKKMEKGKIKFYDSSKKLVWQQNFSGAQFEIHRKKLLKSGTYFYTISENGNAVNAGKIIVN